MKLKSFSEFLFEAKKKKDDEVEVDVTKAQQAYYKDLPKSTASKKKSQITKQADMDSDDPSAYKELPGDDKAQRQDKVKTSEYTKAYHKKFGKKEESVNERFNSSEFDAAHVVLGAVEEYLGDYENLETYKRFEKMSRGKDVAKKKRIIADVLMNVEDSYYGSMKLSKALYKLKSKKEELITYVADTLGRAFESVDEAATERFLKSAGNNLARQMQGKSAGYDILMNRLNSMPLANALKKDDLEKVVDYAMKELGLTEAAKDDDKPDEKLLNQGPIGNPDIEKALKKKQEETGVDIKILRAVMRKGMAAWKAGHRPGATQEQWGYARVNSFLTGGKTIGTKANPGPDGRLGKMAKLI